MSQIPTEEGFFLIVCRGLRSPGAFLILEDIDLIVVIKCKLNILDKEVQK